MLTFFTNIMEGVSAQSILNAEPTIANQVVCLGLAGLLIEIVMFGLKTAISYFFVHVASDRVRDQLFEEAIQNFKDHEEWKELMIQNINKYCKTNGIDHDMAAELEKVDKGFWEETVDAYSKNEFHKKIVLDCAIQDNSGNMAMSLQHTVAGVLGLYAATMTNNKESFLKFARWGILCEAGWEAFDTVKNILYPLIVQKEFGFVQIMLAVHHVTLYFFLPLNMTLLPTDDLGRNIALACFSFAGVVGFQTIVHTIKNYADMTTPQGLGLFVACQTFLTGVSVVTRGLHWPYFAYVLMKYSWGDGWVSWPAFLGILLLVTVFSLFNMMIVVFTVKGAQKAIDKVKTSLAAMEAEKNKKTDVAEEELEVPKKRAKRESVADVIIQDLSMRSASSVASHRRVSLFGVDYELDDTEVKEAKKRHSQMPSSRSSVFAAFASLSEEDLDALDSEDENDRKKEN